MNINQNDLQTILSSDEYDDNIMDFILNKINYNDSTNVINIIKLLKIIPLLQQKYLEQNTTEYIFMLNILDNKINNILFKNDDMLNNIFLTFSNFENNDYTEHIIKLAFIYNDKQSMDKYIQLLSDNEEIDNDILNNIIELKNEINKIKNW